MSNNNISQVLVRNIELFKCQSVLLINFSTEPFIDEVIKQYSQVKITSYNSNFAMYLAHKKLGRYPCFFGETYQENTQHDLIVIQYPKSKAELPFILAMLNQVASSETNIVIVGEKSGGINSSKKVVEQYINHYQKYDAARHCMVFTGVYIPAKTPFNLDDWFTFYQITINDKTIDVAALPGVFSQKKLDVGTRVLLQHLPNIQAGKLLDFGCGAGVIACFAAQTNKDLALTLVDVSALAIASARKTLTLNNLAAEVIATDSMSHITGKFNCVISNPPFHQGLKTNYHATETFLSQINQHIDNKGELIVVANNFLTYRPLMEKSFNKVIDIVNQQGFLVYHSKK